jgi:hypothetical protein
MVGTGRFELPTPRTPSECSTRLSHVPTGRIPRIHPRRGSPQFYTRSCRGGRIRPPREAKRRVPGSNARPVPWKPGTSGRDARRKRRVPGSNACPLPRKPRTSDRDACPVPRKQRCSAARTSRNSIRRPIARFARNPGRMRPGLHDCAKLHLGGRPMFSLPAPPVLAPVVDEPLTNRVLENVMDFGVE